MFLRGIRFCAPLLLTALGCNAAGCSNGADHDARHDASPAGGRSSGSDAGASKLAGPCSMTADCRAPLRCAFERCHYECDTSRDCEAGQRCIADRPFRVCQLLDETDCTLNIHCPLGQLCARDAECRDQCAGPLDCGHDQVCASGACADETELVDGRLPFRLEEQAGSPCAYNSDCPDALVCVSGQCRVECVADRDCPPGSACAPDGRCTPLDAG